MLTLEMPETAIEAAILRGLLKPEETTQAWSVIDSVYRTQLSDRALNWLTDNSVITTEQRTNAAAILGRISDWRPYRSSRTKRRYINAITDRERHRDQWLAG